MMMKSLKRLQCLPAETRRALGARGLGGGRRIARRCLRIAARAVDPRMVCRRAGGRAALDDRARRADAVSRLRAVRRTTRRLSRGRRARGRSRRAPRAAPAAHRVVAGRARQSSGRAAARAGDAGDGDSRAPARAADRRGRDAARGRRGPAWIDWRIALCLAAAAVLLFALLERGGTRTLAFEQSRAAGDRDMAVQLQTFAAHQGLLRFAGQEGDARAALQHAFDEQHRRTRALMRRSLPIGSASRARCRACSSRCWSAARGPSPPAGSMPRRPWRCSCCSCASSSRSRSSRSSIRRCAAAGARSTRCSRCCMRRFR